MNNTIVYTILKKSADKWPDSPAVYDEFGTLTFKQLFEEAEELRAKLLASGVKEGMGIGVMARNSRNFITGIFGVIGCGATVMPLSHQLKKGEVDDVINEAKLHAIMDDLNGVQPIENATFKIKMNVEEFRFAWTNVHK